jgi:uncharacterized protein
MAAVKPAVLLVLALAALLYLAAVAYLYAIQRHVVFQPGGALARPDESGLAGVEVLSLPMPDGTLLSAWHAPAEPGRPTLLYFHGNAGNVSWRAERFRDVLDAGFGLLAPSYRGYPGSGGSPSEAALVADGLALFDWLAGRADGVVLYGESLGTGVAVAVAAERDAHALVLEAPYTATLDIAAEAYPWIPVRLLMKDPFPSRERIARVDEPVLIVHGKEDRVIPVEHGRRLFSLAREPKRLVILEGAGHAELWPRVWPEVLAFLEGLA